MQATSGVQTHCNQSYYIYTETPYSNQSIMPTTRNGVSLPKTEPRPPVSALHDGNIAAIDFGTTSCSLAYCLKGNLDRIEKVKLDQNSQGFRVPTAVLINDQGTVLMFGNDAEDEWNQLCDDPDKKNSHFFFRQIKMNLLREEKITTASTIKAANGVECFLIEVIAIILKKIKDVLITVDLKGNVVGVKDASDFNWVITVPAIWKHKAKQLMREAAYLAGIASSADSVIQKLTVVKRNLYFERVTNSPLKIDRKKIFPSQLSLALEPEGATLFCMKAAELPSVKSCLVVDIGGGTVDVSAITQEGSGETTKVKAILAPAGNDYGGTRVNQAVWEFLGELVNDPNFEEFAEEEPDEFIADMRDIDKRIEQQKLFFGDAQEDSPVKKVVIRLPSSFKTTYSSAIQANIRKKYSSSGDVKLDGRRLEISFRKMEEFFQPAVDAINSCIEKCFRDVKVRLEAVFLVGGFGGCSYIYNKVKPTVRDLSSTCKVFKSPEHTTAVVTGAVMFRKNPEVFCARVADATYGTSCWKTFDHEKYNHSYDYRVYNDEGVAKCNHLFSRMVAKEELLHRDKVIVATFTPGKHGMTSMSFKILATDDKEPYYAFKPNGSPLPGVSKIGYIQVSMPDKRGDKDREVKLIFDFSDTEIQVQAHDLTSGEKASTTVDFLGD